MTTFVLMLPLDASASAFEGFISELDASFHQHELLAGDPDVDGFENTVLAVQVLIAIGRHKARFPAAGLGPPENIHRHNSPPPESKPIDGEYTGHTNPGPSASTPSSVGKAQTNSCADKRRSASAAMPSTSVPAAPMKPTAAGQRRCPVSNLRGNQRSAGAHPPLLAIRLARRSASPGAAR
jgi:hypothetical protein